ncbi:DoxX family protein [Nonomuraea dietziae]
MAMNTTTDTTPLSRGRAVNITLWVTQVLLAAHFAYGGLTKLAAQAEVVTTFETIGFGQRFRVLTGVVELAGAIGLLVPRLSGLAAIGLIGVLTGATLTHLFLLPGTEVVAVFTALEAVVFALVAWGRWPGTKALIASVIRR